MKFVFITKTRWDENPRVRHQLARLLAKNGHTIYFLERPGTLKKSQKFKMIEPSIYIGRPCQLIHHQLRVCRPIAKLNEIIESRSIKSLLESHQLGKADVIFINFNYEASFVREINPSSLFITYLIDDWVAQGRFFKGRHIKIQQDKTVDVSDVLLSTAEKMLTDYQGHNCSHLFMPWSDDEGETSGAKTTKFNLGDQIEKNAVFFWGVIDYRIDFELLERLVECDKKLVIYLIGPVHVRQRKSVEKISRVDNIRVLPPRILKEVLELRPQPLIAIIPYRKGVADIEAVTVSNKTFRILAEGLPIVTTGMPNFYECDATFRANNAEEVLEIIVRLREHIEELREKSIEEARKNDASSRYNMLLSIIENVRAYDQ